MINTVFAYGTLIKDEIMGRVTGRCFPCMEAVLKGFARYRIKGTLFPGITPSAGSEVHGKLYLNINNDSIGKIDEYENDYYDRVEVKVVAEDGRTYSAFTYLVRDLGVLSDEKWDVESYLRG